VGRRELRALVAVTARPLAGPLLVVIPARNEASRIGPTLDALLADPCPTLSILVVDDRSTDGTAALVDERAARDARLRLLRLKDDPAPGVFGKPRALAAAVEDARARAGLPARVLFLDADVRLAPGALGALEAAHAPGVALSGVPRLVVESVAEQLFVPALVSLVTGRFMPSRVHDAKDQGAFLNGQIILVDTATLDDVGGFQRVQHTVLEDVALARAWKEKGHALRLADLRAVASTRMYANFGEIAEGFGKNALVLLGRGAAFVGALSFVTSCLPAASLVLAASSGDAPVVVAVGALVAGVVGVQLALRRMAGAPLWPVLVLPVVYAGVFFVLAKTTARALRGQPVRWRGRSYS
jgi:uncharacterized protein (DUF983 family)